MRNFTALFFVVFLVSCSQNAKTETVNEQSSITLSANNESYPLGIFNQIEAYYIEQWGEEGGSVEKTQDESQLSLSCRNEEVGYSMYSLEVSLSEDFIRGDLNNDSKENIVVNVHIEGNGAGGNLSSNDILIFEKTNNGYLLVAHEESSKICGPECIDGGFYPKSIRDGKIVGKSIGYRASDARCCPSLDHNSIVELVNGKLKFVSYK